MLKKSNNKTILYHKGKLDFDVISELIQELKENIKKYEVRFGVYKKILITMIELLENIIRYMVGFSVGDESSDKYLPLLQISHAGKHFFIESVNPVFNKDISDLKDKLIHLNSLNRKGIRELYKNTITNGKFTESGGAGLGIIEMAKISDKHLEFSFTEVDENISSFMLRVTVRQFNKEEKIISESK